MDRKSLLLAGGDKNMSIWSIQDWPYFSRKRDDYNNRYKKVADEFSSVRNKIIEKIKRKKIWILCFTYNIWG